MATLLEAFPTPHDMILAYRKVKAEIWWMKTVPALRMLSEYEEDLIANLKALRKRIKSPEFNPDDAFLGNIHLLPKSLHPQEADSKKNEIHYRILSDKYTATKNATEQQNKLEHRVMATPSIDFQILGVLWCMGRGGDFDAQRPASCRANILRRNFLPNDESEFPEVESTLRGPINKRYPGLFKPYFQAYKNWRNDGLNKARTAVEGGQRVFALTLDLRRYYHQIDAHCLRKMFPAKDRLSQAFYTSLEAWQRRYGEPLPDTDEPLGIPVGLIASGVVANLLLTPLDEAIEKRLSPIYYGRYVDDFFLVFSLNGEFPTGESVLKELKRLLYGNDEAEPKLANRGTEKDSDYLEFRFNKWEKSRFECKTDKQRLFCLEGKRGRDLLTILDRELKEHSSEWRMLPDLENEDEKTLKEILVANHDAADEATSLRKTDDLSIRRMGIAVALRKLEAIERFGIKSKDWKGHRESFYRIAATHVCTPEGLCDFWPNLPRLFGLVFSNGDWRAANRLLTKIIQASATYESAVKKCEGEILKTWLYEVIQDELSRSVEKPPSIGDALRFFARFEKAFGVEFDSGKTLKRSIEMFLLQDMDRIGKRVRMRSCPQSPEFRNSINELKAFFEGKGKELPESGFELLFPTRPLGELEICRNYAEAISSEETMRVCLFVLRGQSSWSRSNPKEADSDSDFPNRPKHIYLNSDQSAETVRVAISNFKTEETCWAARVRGKPDLSIKRLGQLFGLADKFIRELKDSPWRERPLYFCLPELSVPQEWIFPLAGYFSQAGISLIAGVEYEALTPTDLENPAYLFLRNKTLGYPTSYFIRQTKTEAAPGEAQELWQEGNKKLIGPKPKDLPVFVHGDFRFGVVLCSELSDTEIHHHFRGHVDALFCLEWNQDVETFSSLVQATAQTIHAFVVQVNNRKYGDSRLRAPAKPKYNRDLVRVKGGDHDYYVVGKLPVKDLRDFQRKAHSNLGDDAPFKPLPSGYHPHDFPRLHAKSKP
jgi:hypothetical protein